MPGCRATRNLACHHLEFRSRGGDHEPANLILICDGHHKLLHDGLLVISGRAPDDLTFVRDGKLLVDARSSVEVGACAALRSVMRGGSHAVARHGRNEIAKRSRFEDAVKREQAKQALMQLSFKARAARAAVEAACAHVGAEADVATIVKVALQLSRTATNPELDSARQTGAGSIQADAKQALRQLGYPAAIAEAAVASASAHVGAAADLPALIKEALRRC